LAGAPSATTLHPKAKMTCRPGRELGSYPLPAQSLLHDVGPPIIIIIIIIIISKGL